MDDERALGAVRDLLMNQSEGTGWIKYFRIRQQRRRLEETAAAGGRGEEQLLEHGVFLSVGTLRQEYPLLQDKDEGAQERQPRTMGPDPRGQVPNLRGADLGLYKWKPDLQEA